MIKKLDTLILKAFIGPFIATFFIAQFVLVLQFFWLYIDDIVGKGLDLATIGELITYVAASVVPLALPLAVLLASIMTFGNLGETFELVAIKSAGIPLLRFMRPLFVTSIFICGIAFLFNNYLIPVSTLKLNRIKYDIINKKPAFDLKEGTFYTNIPGYAIKVSKKEKDDSTLTGVIIYEKEYGLRDNIIVAKKGVMKVSKDKRYLEFKLYDGWRYQERGQRMSMNTEFIRLGFKEFKKEFDLSSLMLSKTEDSSFKNNYQLLSIRQLNGTVDSLKKQNKSIDTKTKEAMKPFLRFAKYMDSNWSAVPKAPPIRSMRDMLPDSLRTDSIQKSINDRIVSQASITANSIITVSEEYKKRLEDLRLNNMAWHEKFSLSLACLVLFLIGAPLGSIIRKGGIGMPLVFAVIFFVIFFMLNNFGKRFVKENVMAPLPGIWLSTFILVPIGMFLTYKAMRDSQLFNKEFYFRLIKQLKAWLRKVRLARG